MSCEEAARLQRDIDYLLRSHARLLLALERIAVRSDVSEIANLALAAVRDMRNSVPTDH